MSGPFDRVALPCLRIPDGGNPRETLQLSEPIELTQTWRETPEEGLRSGRVRLAWEPTALWVQADLVDDEIWSTASADSQRLWELGDVFEIFLQIDGRDEYVEMHVAPGGFRMHLRLTGEIFAAIEREEKPLDEVFVRPPAFDGTALVKDGRWSVEVRVPAGELDPAGRIEAGDRWLASFCRYDANSDGTPVLSSTSPHRICRFHRRAEWRPICF